MIHGKNIFAHDADKAVSRLQSVEAGWCVAFGHCRESAGSERLVVVVERPD